MRAVADSGGRGSRTRGAGRPHRCRRLAFGARPPQRRKYVGGAVPATGATWGRRPPIRGPAPPRPRRPCSTLTDGARRPETFSTASNPVATQSANARCSPRPSRRVNSPRGDRGPTEKKMLRPSPVQPTTASRRPGIWPQKNSRMAEHPAWRRGARWRFSGRARARSTAGMAAALARSACSDGAGRAKRFWRRTIADSGWRRAKPATLHGPADLTAKTAAPPFVKNPSPANPSETLSEDTCPHSLSPSCPAAAVEAKYP